MMMMSRQSTTFVKYDEMTVNESPLILIVKVSPSGSTVTRPTFFSRPSYVT